ncbi:hypothetical protein P4H70_23050 [Paenibacillus ehimensis]|uniref:hypothetical protein n=1 Tax=Paenibacillus ehimensis TaxID=79264 RepID=UPI002DBBE0B5|nr:hypothetical protein [Paenibacillus ehimensis]MEC0211823.1 hypothetical protein [Paenibacillus ehimensis]
MKWYFTLKFLIAVCFILFYGRGNASIDMLIGTILLADLFIVPIIYLIVSLIRKRKLAPGEYRVKPEGKRL